MDAIDLFIDTFTHVHFEDLPEKAVQAAKQEVLDSLATALGGSTKAAVRELVELAQEWGGSPQSTVFGYDFRCPAPHAALVNGTMTHALDYDDGHQAAQVHIGCVAVPVCLATAEMKTGVNGRELITALALGQDFLARLALAARPGGSLIESGWHPAPLFGYLGAAAMAGKLLRLEPEKLLNAIGIAYHQCSGNSQAVDDGALTKRMGPGLAARAGIVSALMAEKGITGAHNILEGKYGFFNQYHGGDYSREILVSELGTRFEGANIGDKPYPCCGFGHPHIDAVLSLKKKYRLEPGEVQRIIAYGSRSAMEISLPLEVKQMPRNPVDAQFSLPWEISVALVSGKVTPNDFTEEAIQRQDYIETARKVTPELDASYNRHGVGPGRVTVIVKDGSQYTKEVEHCLGSVEKPMSFEDCADKLRQCAPLSVNPLSGEKIEQVIDMIGNLDGLDDVAEMVRVLG